MTQLPNSTCEDISFSGSVTLATLAQVLRLPWSAWPSDSLQGDPMVRAGLSFLGVLER